ncbi:MAG: ATP-binding protein, partial [Bacteroidales bacterium]
MHVKASNNDGKWNDKGTSLIIRIIPAWWESIPAKLLYGVIFFLALYFFRKYTLISVHLKNQLWLDHQEKQKIEELGRLKLQFFTNISHELRTPLTLILGPLKRLIDEGKADEILHTVYRNALRLKTLVDQILDFSKIENEKMTLQPEERNVVTVILDTLQNFADFSRQKRLNLLFRTNVKSCVAKIDADKIEKIVTNLLSNAIKNTMAGGKVELEVRYENHHLVLIVSDTGQGIAADEIKHIFERFFTSTNTKINRGGTSIGLNLTHKMVELLGGNITVDSKWGKGTTFTIHLPLTELTTFEEGNQLLEISSTALVSPKDSEKGFRPTGSPTIMIVEDDEEMRDYLASLLAMHYHVIVENDPEKALEQLASRLPDVIISDVMMESMDGYEFCKKIKHDMRYCHIPVILLTAKTTVPDQIQGFETGADDYITKPFDERLLISRIENLLENQERIRRQLFRENGEINRNSGVRALDYAFLEKIMEIIRRQYSDPDFNVNHIIEQMGISRSVFYAKLKSLSSQSVNELITNF